MRLAPLFLDTPMPNDEKVLKKFQQMLAENTSLTPEEEAKFQAWVKQSGIQDLNSPEAAYDYRGFFKANGPVPYKWGVDHLPDTFKQHGHETFSQESKYSKGPSDGGKWLPNDTLLEQPPMAVSHTQPLSKAEFANKLLAGEFDNEPWYQKAAEGFDWFQRPLQSVADKAHLAATKLDTYRPMPDSFDMEAALKEIPGAVKDITEKSWKTPRNPEEFKQYWADWWDRVKALGGGTLEGIAGQASPMNLSTAVAAPVLEGAIEGYQGAKTAATAASKAAKSAPKLADLDARITGILTKYGTKEAPVAAEGVVNPAAKATKLPPINTDQRVEELLKKFGGQQPSPIEQVKKNGIVTSDPPIKEYVPGRLKEVGVGKPGLSVMDSESSIPAIGPTKHIVYRGADGAPIAMATVIEWDGKYEILDMAADKTKGLLYGKAVQAVGKKLQAMGVEKVGSTVSPDALNLLNKWRK